MSNTKPILYFDMDNVLVDFPSGIAQLDEKTQAEYVGNLDEVPGIFALMKPLDGAIEAVHQLAENTMYTCFPQRPGSIPPHGYTKWNGYRNILARKKTVYFTNASLSHIIKT